MSAYPQNIVEFRDKVNLPGIEFNPDDSRTLYAEDIKALEGEIVAVEATLGEEVQGTFDTAADRIAAAESAIGGVLPSQSGNGGKYLQTDGTTVSWADAAGGGGGQIIYDAVVASSGGDFPTLEDALNSGADSIFIKNGTYTENTMGVYSGNVTVVGESRDGVIINLPSARTLTLSGNNCRLISLTIKAGGSSPGNGGLIVDADNCAISDVLILESGYNAGLLKVNGNYFKATNCTIQMQNNSVDTQVRIQNVYSGTAPSFDNCLFLLRPAHSAAIIYTQQDNTRFTGCTFIVNSGNSGSGLIFESLAKTNFTGCVFYSLQATNQIALRFTIGGCVVSGCTFNDFARSVDCNSASNTLSGNSFVQNSVATPTGVKIAGSGNSVTGNTIYGRSSSLAGTGIDIGGNDDNVISGNNIQGYATGVNISSSAADRTLLVGNNLHNNTVTINDGGTGTIFASNAV